jgi:hypothetical protein
MTEPVENTADEGRHVYIVIPRKLIIAWISTFITVVILVTASSSWSYYLVRQLCGIVVLSDEAGRANPSPTEIQKKASREFYHLRKLYRCK